MVKYYDEIPEFLFHWITDQKVFWVGTAPLTEDGLVNISPKGVEGSFRIVDKNQVWYEDLTGSGIETVSHVRENSRITILFNAFEGPPRILRLYGRGYVFEFGTPEYDALLPPEKRQIGSRSIIMIDVFKVATSCGYAVPFYTYKAPRNRLLNQLTAYEKVDIAAAKQPSCTITEEGIELPDKGLKNYWLTRNSKSLDGLPGVVSGYKSNTVFAPPKPIRGVDDERQQGLAGVVGKQLVWLVEPKSIATFLAGVAFTATYFKYVKNASAT